ncbi:septum site-determining protein MinC [bacterium]|nr:MAG: septum site-determining protein MinC [bacterium]
MLCITLKTTDATWFPGTIPNWNRNMPTIKKRNRRSDMSADIINIKGTRKGLVICVDSTRDFEELKSTLRAKIASAGSFFKGARFTFYLDKKPLSSEETLELQDICREHGLVPDEQIDPIPLQKKRKLPAESADALTAIGVTQDEISEPGILIRRSLRSGQKIDFQGNVIVLGDVNPGSEITATGDIVVMGALRGTAHAGATGNEEAWIMSYRLTPTQLRIAGKICRPPDKDSGGGGPEVARLVAGQMLIEDYLTHGTKN